MHRGALTCLHQGANLSRVTRLDQAGGRLAMATVAHADTAAGNSTELAMFFPLNLLGLWLAPLLQMASLVPGGRSFACLLTTM